MRPTLSIRAVESASDGSEGVREGEFRFESCQRLHERLEDAAEPVEIGPEPWMAELFPMSIRREGEALVEKSCGALFCSEMTWLRNYELDSFVGPILSYRKSGTEGWRTPGPYEMETAIALDVRTGKPAPFDAVVTADSLLEALKNDRWVQDQWSGGHLREVDELDELIELIEGDGTSEEVNVRGYSFYAWRKQTGETAMRIWFTAGPTDAHSRDLQALGLWVTPKDEFRDAFEAADQGGGFYMSSEDRPVF